MANAEERESPEDRHARQAQEKADYIKARQIRLGHVEAPKAKAKAKAKSEESE